MEDVDPSALAVSSVDDTTRLHRGGDETDIVETDAGLTPVDEEAEERRTDGDDHADDHADDHGAAGT